MTEERTFLTALNEAYEGLTLSKGDLAELARALHFVGNDQLADKLATIAKDLNHANRLVAEGRDKALDNLIHGSQQATQNMVAAALAVADKNSH